MKIKVTVLFFFTLLAFACGKSENMERSEPKKKIEALVSSSLAKGDDKARVIDFFKKQKWRYVTDDVLNTIGARVEFTNEKGAVTHSILVLVKLDKGMKIRETTVEESFREMW